MDTAADLGRRTLALSLVFVMLCTLGPLPVVMHSARASERLVPLEREPRLKPSRQLEPATTQQPPAPVRRGPVTLPKPDVKETFTASEVAEQIARTRVLSLPAVAIGDGPDGGAARADLATALNEFQNRPRRGDPSALMAFVEGHPDSPWNASLLLEIGQEQLAAGYFSRALASWEQAWEISQGAESGRARRMAEQALVYLLSHLPKMGQVERLEELLEEIRTRNLGGAARQAEVLAREALWFFQTRADENILCGILAINAACEHREEFRPMIPDVHDEEEWISAMANGISLAELREHALEDVDIEWQMAKWDGEAPIPTPAVFHWELLHYAAVTEARDGEYRLVDPAMQYDAWVSRQALAEEGSGYFLLPPGELPRGWRPVDEEEGAGVYGRHCNHGLEDEGCRTTAGCSGSECSKAMAVYDFDLLHAGLILRDTPLWYDPPVGPGVAFQLQYKQRDQGQPTLMNFPNVGPRWHHAWGAYIEITGTGTPPSQITFFDADGNYYRFNYDSGDQLYYPRFKDGTVIERIAQDNYVLRFPNGSVLRFEQPDAPTPTRIFQTETADPAGNRLQFTYNQDLQLVEVRDALDQLTELFYDDPNDDMLITKVVDPFQREAILEYDNDGRLVKITDIIGITSEFSYASGDFVEILTTPYGQTRFTTWEHGTQPFRSIKAEDPIGLIEKVEVTDNAAYKVVSDHPPASTVDVDGQQVSFTSYNNNLNWRNSYYWDKQAWRRHPGAYDKAEVYHWTAKDGKLVAIPESIKRANSGRIWFNYPGQSGATLAGDISSPNKIARVVEDGNGGTETQLFQREYDNPFSLPTKTVDPLGRTLSYIYDSNNHVDLTEIRQTRGTADELIASFTYNANHLPLTMTDAAGETTTLTYNTEGQVLTVTNPDNQTTTFTYDNDGFLEEVEGPVTGSTITYTYDGYGRIRTETDSEGYTLTYDYDLMNRLTQITYPDNTTEEFHYDKLDLEWHKDRLDRWTRYFYNVNRELVGVQDSTMRRTFYQWCLCGDLSLLTDANGNTTRWEYDLEGRLLRKIYEDGTREVRQYEPLSGRLSQMTDALDQERHFEYYLDDRLAALRYAQTLHPTPDVEFTYDPDYGRVTTMQDGIGTTAYNYYPIADPPQPGAGMLEEIVGPLPQSVIGFEYDKLGRVSKRTIGAAATEWQFDALGRLEKEINPIGTFEYEYLNQTGQVTKIDYPGDVEARFGYYGNVQDRRLQSIENVRAGSPETRFSEFGYDWNPAGWLTEWTQQRGQDPAMQYALGYDGMGRLTDAVLSEVGSSADPERRHWRYDAVGNRLVDQLDNSVRGASYNGLNQLMELTAGGPMKFRGTVDRPAIVTIDGQAAYVDPGGEFVGYAEVDPGQNQVEIRAEDELENVTVETYEVDVSGVVPRQLTYDLNGNLTNDDIKQYEWDAENRLVGIIYADGGRTEFEYDGLSRRVRQIEKDPQGATTAEYTYLWDGLEIVERRVANGETVQRRYYAHGMEDVTESKDYLIMRDHLGSVRDVVEADGGATVLYSDYDLWGNITSGTAAEFTGFGFTGHFYHERSGLHLAPYRAYDAALGRWISRDPLFMAELLPEGPNLYAYVSNSPVIIIDPAGLIGLMALVPGIQGAVRGGKTGAVVGAISGAVFSQSDTVSGTAMDMAKGALAGGAGGLVGGFVSGYGDIGIPGASLGGSILGSLTAAQVGGLLSGTSLCERDYKLALASGTAFGIAGTLLGPISSNLTGISSGLTGGITQSLGGLAEQTEGRTLHDRQLRQLEPLEERW